MKTERYFYSKPQSKIEFRGYTLDTENFIITEHNFVQLPRICICGLYDKETDKINFGVSRCSSKDQFIKKTARAFAKKRAMESPFASVVVGDNRVYDVFMTYARKFEKEILETHPVNINKSKWIYS